MINNEPLEKQLECEIIKRFIAAAKHPVCDKVGDNRIHRELWQPSETALVINTHNLDEAWEVWHSRKAIYRVCETLSISQVIIIQVNSKTFGAAYCPPDKCREYLDN